MPYQKEYARWLGSPITAAERAELEQIDQAERASRFSGRLEFGTAGLRGLVGLGTGRMNVYTVRAAAMGFAAALKQCYESPSAAVCFDSRHQSREFAEQCTAVLAASGIEVHMFEQPRPTPQLSFAIRHLKLDGGINITASHNPKGYSGFKAYSRGGAQITGQMAGLAAREMAAADLFAPVAKSAATVKYIDERLDELFIRACLSNAIDGTAALKAPGMKIIYTAFHGVGGSIFPEVLRRAGFKNVINLPSQIAPDGDFPTLQDPNPENPAGFALAIELAEREGAHLIIGTDPDADRVAALARGAHGEWRAITGNQMGALLIDYMIKTRKKAGTLPEKYALVQTIVTSPFSLEIAQKNGAVCAETFTGFRFMAECAERLGAQGIEYLLAFEEAIGYMTGGHVRDKDGITAGLIIAEMAAGLHAKGMTLIDALEELWQAYGYFAERTISTPFSGPNGAERMSAIMNGLRAAPLQGLAGQKVLAFEDYLTGVSRSENGSVPLDKTGMDVVIFRLKQAALIVRPSGTEPKIKVYIHVKAEGAPQAESLASALAKEAKALIGEE